MLSKFILKALILSIVLTTSGVGCEWFVGEYTGAYCVGALAGIALIALLIIGGVFIGSPSKRPKLQKSLNWVAAIALSAILSFFLVVFISTSLPIYRGEDEGFIR